MIFPINYVADMHEMPFSIMLGASNDEGLEIFNKNVI